MGQRKEGNLLVLTTSKSNREKITSALGQQFDMEFLETGEAALASLRKKTPDAVILDNSLEDYLTFAFIDKVRNKAPTRNLPFIIVSRESTNSFVYQGVRSGVSHYIGIPFEPKILSDKIIVAIKNGSVSMKEKYFEMKADLDLQVVAFGRISYISPTGIHLETNVSVKAGDVLSITSPLSDSLKLPQIEIAAETVTGDCYYNYPFAVDAHWVDPTVAKKIAQWINAHRNLNAPKKQKVLVVTPEMDLQEKLSGQINQSHFSLRFSANLQTLVEEIPFIQPACLAIDAKTWGSASAGELSKIQKILTEKSIPWILFGELQTPFKEGSCPSPFIAPPNPEGLVLAFEKLAPPLPVEPDRLYFSKTTEDSRLKIHFEGKAKTLGELGLDVALSKEVAPPCNLQINLKIFSEQDLRNPYIRVWPPLKKLNDKDSEKGKYPVLLRSHFLGINDQQGQAIRLWLREEELKEKRKLLEAVPPTKEGKEPVKPVKGE